MEINITPKQAADLATVIQKHLPTHNHVDSMIRAIDDLIKRSAINVDVANQDEIHLNKDNWVVADRATKLLDEISETLKE